MKNKIKTNILKWYFLENPTWPFQSYKYGIPLLSSRRQFISHCPFFPPYVLPVSSIYQCVTAQLTQPRRLRTRHNVVRQQRKINIFLSLPPYFPRVFLFGTATSESALLCPQLFHTRRSTGRQKPLGEIKQSPSDLNRRRLPPS